MNIFGLNITKNKNHIKSVAIKNQARYKVVSGFDQTQRERGSVEHKNEDEILKSYDRNKLLNLTRNAVRNNPTFNSILKQIDLNVIGTKGGKAIFDFPDIELNKEIKRHFGKYTRNVDFFDGFDLNTELKLILKNHLIGGDSVIVFDDGLISDSGKLIVFESDEMGVVPQEVAEKHFGKNCVQSQGRVYDLFGRFIGAIVSKSERGKEYFDPSKCFFLKRNPDETNLDSFWVMTTDVFRVNQGRGVSKAASCIDALTDLQDLTCYELQSAKKNSQTFAQIIDNSPDEETVVPSAFDGDVDNMTDEEIENLSKSEQPTQTISFQQAKTAGILYEAMPKNYEMKLLEVNHPNKDMEGFISWLAGRCSSVWGLSRAFATLDVTGADYKAHQLVTAPAFEEMQKMLERNVLDWLFVRWVLWASRKGLFDYSRLPEDYMDWISWEWNKVGEIDEASHASSVETKLRNHLTTLKDELGNNWREIVEQQKIEADYFRKNGMIYPSESLISGGQSEESKQALEE